MRRSFQIVPFQGTFVHFRGYRIILIFQSVLFLIRIILQYTLKTNMSPQRFFGNLKISFWNVFFGKWLFFVGGRHFFVHFLVGPLPGSHNTNPAPPVTSVSDGIQGFGYTSLCYLMEQWSRSVQNLQAENDLFGLLVCWFVSFVCLSVCLFDLFGWLVGWFLFVVCFFGCLWFVFWLFVRLFVCLVDCLLFVAVVLLFCWYT